MREEEYEAASQHVENLQNGRGPTGYPRWLEDEIRECIKIHKSMRCDSEDLCNEHRKKAEQALAQIDAQKPLNSIEAVEKKEPNITGSIEQLQTAQPSANASVLELNESGAMLIARERWRQKDQEGWTPEHDDQHDSAEMSSAAIAYTEVARIQGHKFVPPTDWSLPPDPWPWDREWWKPSEDPIRNLVKAGALIAAEIDRLQRSVQARKERS